MSPPSLPPTPPGPVPGVPAAETRSSGVPAAEARSGGVPAAEVLIVEDDALNVRLLEQVCRNSGYATRSARDGIEGLEAIAAQQPDLVLLDVMMPRLNGYGVLEALRSEAATRDLPVVMVTAVQNDEARARCIELGADDYVTKPFRIAELRLRMESTLAMHRYRQVLLSGNPPPLVDDP